MVRPLAFLILCSVFAVAISSTERGAVFGNADRLPAFDSDICGNCQVGDNEPYPEPPAGEKDVLLEAVAQVCSAEERRLKDQFTREVSELVGRLATVRSASSFLEKEAETRRQLENLKRLKLLRLEQQRVDCKMEYAKVLNDEEILKNRVVPGLHLETYSIKAFTHCALSAKGDRDEGIQIEMVPTGFENISQYGINAKVSIFGFIKKGIADIYKFPSLQIRKEMYPGDWAENVSYPICAKDGKQRSLDEYKSCFDEQLGRYAGSMADSKKKSFVYDPFLNNCCHFVEKILSACGLTSCFGFPHSSGLDLGFKKATLKTR